MSSIPKRQFLATTALASFDSIICAFSSDLHRRGEVTRGRVRYYRAPARHFLVWLESSAISLEAVDLTVIDRFLQHECDCCAIVPTSARLHPWRKRRTSPEVMRFVRFLERTGRIETPGDLDDNLGLLDAFLERLRGDGYSQQCVTNHRCACAALLVWLHLSRIQLCDLTPDVYARFRDKPLICPLPDKFGGRGARSMGGVYVREISSFLGYLAALGRIEPLDPAPEQKNGSERLETFATWLERNRDIRPRTIRRYTRLIATLLPALGDDPRSYDATLIRQALFESIQHRARESARDVVTAMRTYLRFLVSEGCVAATLVEAVPTVPRWRMATLPRHLVLRRRPLGPARPGDPASSGTAGAAGRGYRCPVPERYRLGPGRDPCLGKVRTADGAAAAPGRRRRALYIHRDGATQGGRAEGVPLRPGTLAAVH